MAATYWLAIRANMEFATEAARDNAYSEIKGKCVDHGSGATEKAGRFEKWDEDSQNVATPIYANQAREAL